MTTHLQQALEALYGLERHKDKLGLEGTRSLLGALGDPHRRFRSVHVAGTNGKGSVCALIERVLREAGHHTGLFTSPHLVDFRERIRVDGRWVDEAWLEGRLDHIRRLPEERERTFFEVCTALAFDYFAERDVEIAVVEVGLGGRLDCTNVITPEVTVITSVGFDHTEILGDTLERIAREKAGIIKPGVPLVTGVHGRGPARRVIEAVAAEQGAAMDATFYEQVVEIPAPDGRPLFAGTREFLVDSPWGERVELPRVRTQPSLRLNENLALSALGHLVRRGVAIPWAAVERGLARARWPGRLERSPGQARLWWDGAHNVSAAMKLRALWRDESRPGAIVLALSRDKDAEGFLRVLRWDFSGATIVTTRSRSERAMEPAAIAAQARAFGFETREASDVPTAVREALELAGEAPVLLTGSLFAVGEAMAALGGAPGEWS
ncbi:MAG TPA: folylpolyglutamate synthase/dihydrofolate synthase family protein [Candidatus Eisenbacteria bacterium]